MKVSAILLALTVIIFIAACSYEQMADKFIPKEESQFAQDYLQKLHEKDFDYVKKYIDPSIQSQVSDQKLVEVADYFPSGELLSTEIIGSQVNVFNSKWQGNFSFEYRFAGGWALANVVLQKSEDTLKVIGFNVYRTEASQKEINKFTLFGKSVLQYLVLAAAVIAPIFILITTYFCARTPISNRKWLWILFVLFGVCSVSVNWTTGQFGVQPVSVNFLSASAMSAGPFAPWIISASIPLGAIVFWIKRNSFIEVNRANKSQERTE